MPNPGRKIGAKVIKWREVRPREIILFSDPIQVFSGRNIHV